MTTGPETIAKAIIDAAHILARALNTAETPKWETIQPGTQRLVGEIDLNRTLDWRHYPGKTAETPEEAPVSPEQAEVASVDPEGNHTPERPVEAAARVLRAYADVPDGWESWESIAQVLADAGLLTAPRPMTVGQLTAAAKRLRDARENA